MRPNRIILIRHGESEGNADPSVYKSKPDYALELSAKGMQQAQKAGTELAGIVNKEICLFLCFSILADTHDV